LKDGYAGYAMDGIKHEEARREGWKRLRKGWNIEEKVLRKKERKDARMRERKRES